MQDLLWLLFCSVVGVLAFTSSDVRLLLPKIQESQAAAVITKADQGKILFVSFDDEGFAKVDGRKVLDEVDLCEAVAKSEKESVVFSVGDGRRFHEVIEAAVALKRIVKKVEYAAKKE